jgi:signal transduction histidine kinase
VSRSTTELRSLHEFLTQLPLFSELTTADVAQICRSSRRVIARPGEMVIREGAAGDALYVILSGELEVTKQEGEQEIVLATRRTGEVLGEMSLLEGSPRSASARAVRETELLEIGPDAFRDTLERNPAVASAILRTMAGRLRSTESALIQRERLAALGTLAAGLAHELNNPAAAIQRSSELLGESFESWRQHTAQLQSLELSAAERAMVSGLAGSIADCGLQLTGAAVSSAAEGKMTSWLESLGVERAWEVAPALLACGWTREKVEPIVAAIAHGHLNVVLQWLAAGLSAQELIDEIQRSSRAISDIVGAVKTHSHLDRAPVQEVDVPESLENTLVILRHKLKNGIEVVRHFEADLPRLEARAGELNQVWTNLIDNAVQAMDGTGRIELHARRLGDMVEVKIVDSGPGIPPEIASRVFDPFFTTKEPGVGTGLGLHISHNIVVNRHHGRLELESQPGRTTFRVMLPLRLRREDSGAVETAEDFGKNQ